MFLAYRASSDALSPRRLRARAVLAQMRAVTNRGPVVASRDGTGPVRLRLRGDIGAGGITASAIERALAQYPRAASIAMEIDSDGGDPGEALKIYHSLKSGWRRVSAHVPRRCISAATIVYLGADDRKARWDAEFLIHGIAHMFGADDEPKRWTAEEHQAAASQLSILNHRILGVYADRCRAGREFFARELKTETSMSAGQALNCGLVHRVVGLVDGDEE